jgi:hypothetical protein
MKPFAGDRPSEAVTAGRDGPLSPRHDGRSDVNLLYVILIIVLVLALLGFVGRGRW